MPPSDLLTPEERERLREWAITFQNLHGGSLLSVGCLRLLDERDRLAQERDALKESLRKVLRDAECFDARDGAKALDGDSLWCVCPWCGVPCNVARNDPHQSFCEAAKAWLLLGVTAKVEPATHPAEEPKETPP